MTCFGIQGDTATVLTKTSPGGEGKSSKIKHNNNKRNTATPTQKTKAI